MRLADLQALNEARLHRRAAVLVQDVNGGTERLISEEGLRADDPLHDEARARFRSGASGMVETATGQRFFNVFVPPPRLMIIGAVHVSQFLAPMAQMAGYDVVIIDPRGAFATPGRFLGVSVFAEWPQDALTRLGLDRYTALATLTHDPKIDDPALVVALQAECFYVGALGSKKTHGARQARLKAAGIDEALFARIQAPIGLDLGGRAPAEIAVAVLAQIIKILRRGGEAAR